MPTSLGRCQCIGFGRSHNPYRGLLWTLRGRLARASRKGRAAGLGLRGGRRRDLSAGRGTSRLGTVGPGPSGRGPMGRGPGVRRPAGRREAGRALVGADRPVGPTRGRLPASGPATCRNGRDPAVGPTRGRASDVPQMAETRGRRPDRTPPADLGEPVGGRAADPGSPWGERARRAPKGRWGRRVPTVASCERGRVVTAAPAAPHCHTTRRRAPGRDGAPHGLAQGGLARQGESREEQVERRPPARAAVGGAAVSPRITHGLAMRSVWAPATRPGARWAERAATAWDGPTA
jgi:hypothetical protein